MKKWMVGVAGAFFLSGAGLLWAQSSAAQGPTPTAASPSKAPSEKLASATLSVEGMTCASCTVTVRMVLKKLDGVKDAEVKLDEKRAVVRYDPAKVTPLQLAEAVSGAGYRANVVAAQHGS